MSSDIAFKKEDVQMGGEKSEISATGPPEYVELVIELGFSEEDEAWFNQDISESDLWDQDETGSGRVWDGTKLLVFLIFCGWSVLMSFFLA